MSFALRVAFLTGQSDPGRCGLAPQERTFLATLAGEDIELVPRNYPWRGREDWRRVPLWRASLANAHQYLAARRGRVDAAEIASAWLAEGPRTLLLAGSCGLALLAALDLSPAVRARLHLFAYGPVAPRWPAGIAGTAVLGRRDPLARWLAPAGAPAARLVDAGHLDYLASPTVRALAREELARLRDARLEIR